MNQDKHKSSIINTQDEYILLALLPFWSPLIPPIGIASLKSYLAGKGHRVKALDITNKAVFRELYENYFDVLRRNIPENKRGNFYSIGHDVLRNHMMSYLNGHSQDTILVKILVHKTFFTQIDVEASRELSDIIDEIFNRIETYVSGMLEEEKPSVLGLSVFSDTLPASLYVFKLVREKFPHIKTCMGGGVFADQLAPGSPNYDVFLEETKDYVDAVFIGEGEILLDKWLNGELPASRKVHTLDDIGWQIVDLESADLLDLSDFDVDQYPFNVSYTSRSCPFQCSFCSETVQWGKYRKKKAVKIVDEVQKLYDIHKTRLFLFSDSLLNPVIEPLSDQFLESDRSIYWEGWLRVDKNSCDQAHTFKWRRSGFYQARIGIESGSQHVLDLMDKRVKVEDAKKSLAALSAAGIKTTTLWVIGHPGETEEHFQETLKFLEDMRNEIYEAECRPFYFYLTGQAGADDDWWKQFEPAPLYPDKVAEILRFQTWLLDCEPPREVIYERTSRFVAHCKKLGIPNPYSMQEMYEADQRWQKLHKNAVPFLIDFKNKDNNINECRNIKEQMTVPDMAQDIDAFDF